MAEITDPKNDFNLNLPRYIDSSASEDVQDLSAHLFGGIPNADIDDLGAFFKVMPSLRAELFEPFTREGYSLLKVDPADVLDTIYANPEYKKFVEATEANYQNWLKEFSLGFVTLNTESKPKLIISTISEALLDKSRELALVDPYSIYQVLMSYWSSVLQDDAFLIASVGWLEAAQLQSVIDAANGVDVTAGKTKFRSDLLPAHILIDAFLPELRDALLSAEAESMSLQGELDVLVEEEGGDEGLLNEVVSDKGKVVKKQLLSRIKEISSDTEFADELAVLGQVIAIIEKLDTSNTRIKVLNAELNDQLVLRYKDLDETTIKKLALAKWENTLSEAVELDRSRVSQDLADRISSLGQRYDEVLSDLIRATGLFETRVETHLQSMGLL